MDQPHIPPARRDLTRRGALTLIAATASGVFLPRALLAQTADVSRLIAANGVCSITPEVTEGPFYFDPHLLRADIREDRKGVPVTLQMQMVDQRCQPIPKARVDLWHCDALGHYSNYGEGRSPGKVETFLRGTQMADEHGVARFETIYPGWYRGRTTHMHFKVFADERNVLTGQIFFPDALSEYIYRNIAPYSAERADRDIVNRNDFIARQAGSASFAYVKEGDEGYLVSLIVGIDPASTSAEADAPRVDPGVRPPPPPGGPEGPPPGSGRGKPSLVPGG